MRDFLFVPTSDALLQGGVVSASGQLKINTDEASTYRPTSRYGARKWPCFPAALQVGQAVFCK